MEPKNLFETIQAFKKKEYSPNLPVQSSINNYDFKKEVLNLFKGQDYDFITNKITSLQEEKESELETLNNPNIDPQTKKEVEERLNIINHNISLYIEIESLVFQYAFTLETHFLVSGFRYYFLRYFSETENKSVFQKFFKTIMLPLIFSENLEQKNIDGEIELLIHQNYPNYNIYDFKLNLLIEAILPFFNTAKTDVNGNPKSQLQLWAFNNDLENYLFFFTELDYRLLLLMEYFKTKEIPADDLTLEIDKNIKKVSSIWEVY